MHEPAHRCWQARSIALPPRPGPVPRVFESGNHRGAEVKTPYKMIGTPYTHEVWSWHQVGNPPDGNKKIKRG